jgi:hypothetical protein
MRFEDLVNTPLRNERRVSPIDGRAAVILSKNINLTVNRPVYNLAVVEKLTHGLVVPHNAFRTSVSMGPI